MATVGTLFPSTQSTITGSTTSTSNSSASTSNGTDALANTSTFLQLLVAQLQYQDPTQPMDGTTFVTQLAQFSDLQANIGSEQDLNAISQQYAGKSTPTASVSGS